MTSKVDMIKIVKGAEVDGPSDEAGDKRHGVFAYHADPELYPKGEDADYETRVPVSSGLSSINND